MRILHTSDWHLGRSFGSVSLSSEQERFCEMLVEMVDSEGLDLVVIAGDIYDRAIAPTESIELFRETVRRIHATGTTIAAISGNHDGADRVSPYDDLLDASGVYIRGGYEGVGRVVRHEFADGPLDLVLLPFLDPQGAPDQLGQSSDNSPMERRRRRTHHEVLEAAIDLAIPSLSSPRSLAVAHAFVTGGSTSESERQLEVGGTGEVSANLFNRFSYTALGHLHRPQHIARETVRYSGTPMPYSYSEDHQKSVTIIDLDVAGSSTVSTIDINVSRGVRTVTGTIEELIEPSRHPEAHDHFVRAIVTNRETVLDAKAKLETIYPYVTEVLLQPAGGTLTTIDGPRISVNELQPLDAVTEFWTDLEGGPPEGELLDILTSAVDTALRSES
jgi:exonuclease SbcD